MNKFYACSDLHGRYDLYEKILEYLDNTDKLVYLGDACDRGPDGIKVIQSILKDDRVIYLLGNHERMFLNAVKSNSSDWFDRYGFNYYNDMELWAYNGGQPTYNEFLKLDFDEQDSIRKSLANLPIYVEYKNKNNQQIFLCHSGIDIDKIDNVITQEKIIEFHEGYATAKIFKIDENPFIWNRDHLHTEHWSNNIKYNNTYMIHGHTPTISLNMINPKFNIINDAEIVKYCDEHKIDIDIGAYFTNRTVLLDLDTFEPIYIQ